MGFLLAIYTNVRKTTSATVLLAVGNAGDGDHKRVPQQLRLRFALVRVCSQPSQHLCLNDVQWVYVRVPNLYECKTHEVRREGGGGGREGGRAR